MANNFNPVTGNMDTSIPGGGAYGISYVAPSLYCRVHDGGSPWSSQFHSLAIPPVSFSGDQNTYPLDIGIVDGNGNKSRMRNFTSATKPRTHINKDGTIYVKGTDSTTFSQPLTAKVRLIGQPIGKVLFVVLDVTNEGNTPIDIIPNIAMQTRLTNIRYYNAGNENGDIYSWDNANKTLNLVNSGIANIFAGFSAVSALPIHYLVTDTDTDELAATTSVGNIGDTKTVTGTSSKYVYIQIGDTTHRTTILAGETSQFVFILAYDITQNALNTAISNAKNSYSTDIINWQNIGSSSILTLNSNGNLTLLDQAFEHILRSSSYMANLNVLEGFKHFNAGSYTFLQTFGRDGYYAGLANCQTGYEENLKDEYLYMKSKDTGDHSCYQEIGVDVTSSGLTPLTPFREGTPGDHELYQILKAYQYYITTLDGSFLGAEIAYLNSIADYLYTYFVSNKTQDGLYVAHGGTTYPDNYGNVTDESQIADPVQISTLIYALNRLAELNEITGNTTKQEHWTTWANDQQTKLNNILFNKSLLWPYMNEKQDKTLYNNTHLPKIDVLVFDVLTDQQNIQSMLTRILDDTFFWNNSDVGFRELPASDALYSDGSYWYGSPWHLTDYKCFSSIFRYGTREQARNAWQKLIKHTQRIRDHNYFRPGERNNDCGLFQFSAGALTEMIVRGLFGIDVHATYFTINPNVYKLGLSGTWVLNNIKMGNQIYTITVSGNHGQQNTPTRYDFGGDTNINVTFSGRVPI